MNVNRKRVALYRVGECISEGRFGDLEMTVLKALDMGLSVEIVAAEIARAWKATGDPVHAEIAEGC